MNKFNKARDAAIKCVWATNGVEKQCQQFILLCSPDIDDNPGQDPASAMDMLAQLGPQLRELSMQASDAIDQVLDDIYRLPVPYFPFFKIGGESYKSWHEAAEKAAWKMANAVECRRFRKPCELSEELSWESLGSPESAERMIRSEWGAMVNAAANAQVAPTIPASIAGIADAIPNPPVDLSDQDSADPSHDREAVAAMVMANGNWPTVAAIAANTGLSLEEKGPRIMAIYSAASEWDSATWGNLLAVTPGRIRQLSWWGGIQNQRRKRADCDN